MRYGFIVIAAALAVNFTACKKEAERPTETSVVKPNLVFYGITASGQLSKYNANAAESPITAVSLSGLQPGEKILSIDFRPATG